MAVVTEGLHLVKETTVTTGDTTAPFNLTLAGAVLGFEAFEDRLGVGNQTWVYLRHNTAWMFFLGTLTAFDTLRIDTVLASSDNDNPLVLGTGEKQVYISTNMDAVSSLLSTSISLGKLMAQLQGSHAG